MSTSGVSSQFQQFRTDMKSFRTDAQAAGLDIKSIAQQAISGLGPNATEDQKRQAAQAAISQAVASSGNTQLQGDFQKVTDDKSQLPAGALGGAHRKGHHHHHKKGAGAAQPLDPTMVAEAQQLGISTAGLTSDQLQQAITTAQSNGAGVGLANFNTAGTTLGVA